MVDSTVRWLCTLPFSPSSVPSLPILQTPGGAGLAKVPTIDEVGPGVRSPCPFFLSLFKASLLSLPQPLFPLMVWKPIAKQHPAPLEASGPLVHGGTPLLPGIPGLAHALMTSTPDPLGVFHPSPLCLCTHLDGLASAPSAPLAGLTVPWPPRV